MSVAKGMAAALSIPSWAVSSLDVLAHAAGAQVLPIRAVLEAGRGRFATALYAGGAATEEARLVTLDQLAASLVEPTLVIGELPEEARERLGVTPNARLADRASSLRRAGFLAELGWQKAQSGDPGDPRLIDALYVS